MKWSLFTQDSGYNYRSCQETHFRLNKNLSVLIGTNGSGKTNVLNGILLLKKLVNLKPWHYRKRERGHNCLLDIEFDVEGTSLKYQAAISYTWNPKNVEELIGAEEQWNFSTGQHQGQWVSLPLGLIEEVDEIKVGRLEDYIRHRHALVHGQEKGQEPYIPSKDELALIRKVNNFARRVKYYSASQFTNPSECPPYIELEGEQFSWSRGSGSLPHSRFLSDLYKAYSLPQRRNEYIAYESLVGKQGIGLVDKIRFHPIRLPASQFEVRTGGKIERKHIRRDFIVPQFTIHASKLSPSQLSEGTFKTLAVLFYLTTDVGSMLLLEEPEVCVHHGLLASIMELIKVYSVDKQIVITTHSDFVLDMVSPENVFRVQKFARKGTIVKHLPKTMSARGYAALKEYLETSGNLGEYWRQTSFENG